MKEYHRHPTQNITSEKGGGSAAICHKTMLETVNFTCLNCLLKVCSHQFGTLVLTSQVHVTGRT